ncbi:NUDIX pyrophosphatase [Candidatus Neomarinimicrobiota bacterium]
MTDVVVRVIDLHIMRWVDGIPGYLLLQRAAGEIYAQVWQGVTGKIKSGETAWQAAIRELYEETGLAPVRMWTVDHVNFFYEADQDRMNSIPVFGVEVEDYAVMVSREHQRYLWCDIDQAAKLILWEQQRRGLLAFNDMLINTKEKKKWMEIDLSKSL